MNVEEQIKKFIEFFESYYLDKIIENVRKSDFFVVIDFLKLAAFDIELSELLIEEPEETLKAAEVAIKQLELPREVKKFYVRLDNLPENLKMQIREIRSKHLGKLIFIEGVVRQKSDVRPQLTSARFECPSCGNIITVLQLDSKFKEPTRCSCGRKGKFSLLGKELIDAQVLVLEEAAEDLEGGEQPKRINVFLKDDLVSPLTEKRTNPGNRVRIIGYVREVPIMLRTGAQSTRFDLIFEANNVIPIEEDFYELEISEEDEKKIKELAEDPKLMKKLISSIAPSIYGYEKIKEALLLQLVGGVKKERKDGVITRGDIHILLVGDPGSGKSQLLKTISRIAPKGRYVSGKGASGTGLTATVVKDEFLRGWALEAGALVLANKGLLCIDELDKMTKEDTSAMHEAMEQQMISISKANIQATLRAETTILAAANPKLGRFDPYELISKQIDLPLTLINRFDLIFPVKDLPDKDKDEKMALHILEMHSQPESKEPEIDLQLLRKYISYAKQRIFPKLTPSATEEIKRYYLEMRSQVTSEEDRIKTIAISPRQLEALIRLAEASARLRLSNKVTKKDARRAIDLLNYCLEMVGLDKETGKIDIDRIATGVPASRRSKIHIIKEIIEELENKAIPVAIADVIKYAEKENISAAEAEEIIENLKRLGDIFEPKRGFIQRL